MSVTFTPGTAAGSIEDDGAVMSGSLLVESFGDATYSFRTNGYHGGDNGHGGFAEIGIETTECFVTHVAVEVTRNITGPPSPLLVYEDYGNPVKIVVRVRGDAEIRALAKGLQFIARQLGSALDAIDNEPGDVLVEDPAGIRPPSARPELPQVYANPEPGERLVEMDDVSLRINH